MKIISKSDTIHQIKIIPRKYAEITTAKITHELTDKTTTLDFNPASYKARVSRCIFF